MTDTERSARDKAGLGEQAEAGRPIFTPLAGLFQSARDSIGDTLKVVALEGRLAALTLLLMLIISVVAVLFVIAAWLFLWAALAIWVVLLGVPWPVVLLIAALLHIVLLGLAWLWIRKLSHNLSFAASRRSIKGSAAE